MKEKLQYGREMRRKRDAPIGVAETQVEFGGGRKRVNVVKEMMSDGE